MNVVFVFALLVIGAASAGAADPELYFSKTSHSALSATPLVYGPRDSIEFILNFRARSIEDRERFPELTIADRDASVRFDVKEIRRGIEYLAASYRVESLDRREVVDGPYRMANLRFLLGRSQPLYWIADHFGGIGWVVDKHWEGTYRIRAFYREFTSPPIFVTVR